MRVFIEDKLEDDEGKEKVCVQPTFIPSRNGELSRTQEIESACPICHIVDLNESEDEQESYENLVRDWYDNNLLSWYIWCTTAALKGKEPERKPELFAADSPIMLVARGYGDEKAAAEIAGVEKYFNCGKHLFEPYNNLMATIEEIAPENSPNVAKIRILPGSAAGKARSLKRMLEEVVAKHGLFTKFQSLGNVNVVVPTIKGEFNLIIAPASDEDTLKKTAKSALSKQEGILMLSPAPEGAEDNPQIELGGSTFVGRIVTLRRPPPWNSGAQEMRLCLWAIYDAPVNSDSETSEWRQSLSEWGKRAFFLFAKGSRDPDARLAVGTE
ncbi:hypothetical protein ACFOES_05780 [Acidimangrovimonas pyrenivorans]|uniref:Uncharacterized protein n=1 Tax=Acidimangrovimonas pyrenivorans TaxID=2030798 RepID=A0ABV7AEJ5_9RHOB